MNFTYGFIHDPSKGEEDTDVTISPSVQSVLRGGNLTGIWCPSHSNPNHTPTFTTIPNTNPPQSESNRTAPIDTEKPTPTMQTETTRTAHHELDKEERGEEEEENGVTGSVSTDPTDISASQPDGVLYATHDGASGGVPFPKAPHPALSLTSKRETNRGGKGTRDHDIEWRPDTSASRVEKAHAWPAAWHRVSSFLTRLRHRMPHTRWDERDKTSSSSSEFYGPLGGTPLPWLRAMPESRVPLVAHGTAPFATAFYSSEGIVVKYCIVLHLVNGQRLAVDRRYRDLLSLHHVLKKVYYAQKTTHPSSYYAMGYSTAEGGSDNGIAPVASTSSEGWQKQRKPPIFPRFPRRGILTQTTSTRLGITFLLQRRREMDAYIRSLTSTMQVYTNTEFYRGNSSESTWSSKEIKKEEEEGEEGEEGDHEDSSVRRDNGGDVHLVNVFLNTEAARMLFIGFCTPASGGKNVFAAMSPTQSTTTTTAPTHANPTMNNHHADPKDGRPPPSSSSSPHRDCACATAVGSTCPQTSGGAHFTAEASTSCFLDDGLEPDALRSLPTPDARWPNTSFPTGRAGRAESTVPSTPNSTTHRRETTPHDGDTHSHSSSRSSSDHSACAPVSMNFFTAPSRILTCACPAWIKTAYGSEALTERLPLDFRNASGAGFPTPIVPTLPCMSAIPTLVFGLPHAKLCFDHLNLRELLVVLRSDGHEPVQSAVRRRDELVAFYAFVAQQHALDVLPSTEEARLFFSEYRKKQRLRILCVPVMRSLNLQDRLLPRAAQRGVSTPPIMSFTSPPHNENATDVLHHAEAIPTPTRSDMATDQPSEDGQFHEETHSTPEMAWTEACMTTPHANHATDRTTPPDPTMEGTQIDTKVDGCVSAPFSSASPSVSAPFAPSVGVEGVWAASSVTETVTSPSFARHRAQSLSAPLESRHGSVSQLDLFLTIASCESLDACDVDDAPPSPSPSSPSPSSPSWRGRTCEALQSVHETSHASFEAESHEKGRSSKMESSSSSFSSSSSSFSAPKMTDVAPVRARVGVEEVYSLSPETRNVTLRDAQTVGMANAGEKGPNPGFPFPQSAASLLDSTRACGRPPLCWNSAHLVVSALNDVMGVKGAPRCRCTLESFCQRRLDAESQSDMYKTASGYTICVEPPPK